MSVSSGASTPRGSVTPPPPGDGPSPLTVGTRFVKQYYKVLSTTPEEIYRFYQPTSVLSEGVGSQPTQPATFESLKASDQLKSRFTQEGYERCPIRFEFEHGAIDAQVSVNAGILLVVTGHVVYLEEEDQTETGEDTAQRRKAFVHTFFLGSISVGAKRSYYVHNDILRFLHDDEEKTVVVSNKSPGNVDEVQLPLTVEEPPAEVVSTPKKAHVGELDAPGGGVEETKDPVLEESDDGLAEVELATKVDESDGKETHALEETKGAVTPDAKAKTPSEGELEESKLSSKSTPGSWASLVATGGGTIGSTPATPIHSAVRPSPAKPKPIPVPTPAPAAAVAASPEAKPDSSKAARPQIKRDPDCTLVVRNIDLNAKEVEVIGLFEPYATKFEATVVGVTVSGHKGIAFIDYDIADPVLAAVEQHEKEPFALHGKVLEVYQKTHEHKYRRGGGVGRGSFRGGPAAANGGSFRGSGARQPFRRGGRSERASGRGGRSSR